MPKQNIPPRPSPTVIKVYEYIVNYMALAQHAPTISEIASSLSMSRSSAQYYVKQLVRMSCVSVTGQRRGIIIHRHPKELLTHYVNSISESEQANG